MKKKFWILLGCLLIGGIAWHWYSADPRPARLTEALYAHASPQLENFPYKFRVMKMDGSTAILSTPRNEQVPVSKALGVLYPRMNVNNPSDPDFIAAERELGQVQAEARAIVLAQPGVTAVRFELDRDWLADHYIEVPQ